MISTYRIGMFGPRLETDPTTDQSASSWLVAVAVERHKQGPHRGGAEADGGLNLMLRAKVWVPAVTWGTPVVEQFSELLSTWPPMKWTIDPLKVPATSPPSTISEHW